MKTFTRRDFLNAAATAISGVVAGGAAPPSLATAAPYDADAMAAEISAKLFADDGLARPIPETPTVSDLAKGLDRTLVLGGGGEYRACVTMTIDDALHFTEEQRKQIVASYQPYEREARVKGVPVLGSGRIFPVAEESITCDGFDIPAHWPRIGGMDFGWDHPFAAVELCWDRDTDAIYITKCHRQREATPVIHAAALKPWNLQWAWTNFVCTIARTARL